MFFLPVSFGLGFLLPVLWFVGAMYARSSENRPNRRVLTNSSIAYFFPFSFIRSNNASAKAAGIASLCMGITAFLTAVILILIFVFAN